jgi:hypothetical protein
MCDPNLEPMEAQMRTAPTVAGATELPRWTKFVVVNGRVPREDAYCALCGKAIERGYVRTPQTRLLYCDTACLGVHEATATPTVEHRVRRVS